MLTDMLQALEEGQTVRESDVIGDLRVACQQMQQRVMGLVAQLSNEDLMAYVAWVAPAWRLGRETKRLLRDWGCCQQARAFMLTCHVMQGAAASQRPPRHGLAVPR